MQYHALQVNPTPQLLHGDKELTQGAYERIYKALGRETIIKIMGPSCSLEAGAHTIQLAPVKQSPARRPC